MSIRNAIGTIGAVALISGLIMFRLAEQGIVLVGGVTLLLIGTFACIWAWGEPQSDTKLKRVRPSRRAPWDDGEY